MRGMTRRQTCGEILGGQGVGEDMGWAWKREACGDSNLPYRGLVLNSTHTLSIRMAQLDWMDNTTDLEERVGIYQYSSTGKMWIVFF